VKIDRVVINASPLIVLFKCHLAHLLPQLFAEVSIPGAVYDEVLRGSAIDIAAQQLPASSWAKRVEVTEIPPTITAWNLGIGESEVLALALANPGARAMLDDAAARHCARVFNVPLLGTGGAMALAKRRGLIGSLESCLQSLREGGLWMSDDIISILLKQVGE
jgi:predicted nucleic acid-binding protein